MILKGYSIKGILFFSAGYLARVTYKLIFVKGK